MAELRIPGLVEGVLESGQYALVGGNVVGFYTKPRATLDVDLLVDPKTYRKIRKILKEKGIEFKETGDALETLAGFDALNAAGHPLWEKALSERVKKGPFFIPTREGLIGMKYLAAISPSRSYENKSQDVTDIVKLLSGAGRDALMKYISILGEAESRRFTEGVLKAYDEKRPVVV